MIEEVGQNFGPEFASVFNTHVQILEDHGFVTRLEREVGETADACEAIRRAVDHYRKLFSRIEDPYFRERGDDVEDVGRRVMAKLLGVRHRNVPLAPGSVVVTSMILPAHFTMLEMDKVAAIVAEHGGATSHGAIFARTLEIPSVTGVEGAMRLARPGEIAIVDGTSGRIYLSPDEGVLAEYRRAQQRFEIVAEHLDGLRARPAETRDGRRVVLSANVGLLADLRLVERHGAEGIGLFRTELLALAHRGAPPEDEQEILYERVARAMDAAPGDDPHARSRRRQGGAEPRARSRGEPAARLPLGAPHDAPRRADARAAARDPARQRRRQRAAAAADDLVARRAARGEAPARRHPGRAGAARLRTTTTRSPSAS